MRQGLCLALVLAISLVLAPQAAGGPAHGRAWELVSAQDSLGVQLFSARGWSVDGNRVAYASLGPLPGAAAGELVSTSVAVRGADGWESHPVGQPFTATTAQAGGVLSLAASRDLSTWIWGSTSQLLPGAPSAPMAGLYRRAPDGTLSLLGPIAPGSFFGAPSFLQAPVLPAASDDVGHAGFNSTEPLLPADSGRVEGRAAYELDESGLQFAGVDDEGQPLSTCGSVLGNGVSGGTVASHPMSRDGSRIFLTSPDPSASACAEPTRVYLREGATTTSISASQCTRPDCNPPADVNFMGAPSDGSSALLATTWQLTDDDVDSGNDLYRADPSTGDLTRLSAGPPGVSANVLAPIRAASEGDRVYFIATGALVPGKGTAGGRNLYLSDGGEIRFVATLSKSGSLNTAAVSEDGGALLFSTTGQVLPGDVDIHSDVYRYDADEDALQQVSIGEQGQGNEALAATIPGPGEYGPFPGHDPNPLTADGTRAFIETKEALVAEDTNGEHDVYEWWAGSVGLVSSGAGSENGVAFGGASADGGNAFFSTRESLLPGDDDGGEIDLYAARIGGGFPEAEPPPPCEGEECQGPLPSPGPERAAPATATLAPLGGDLSTGGKERGFAVWIGPRARRELAKTGQAGIHAWVPSPGRVSLVGIARVGDRLAVVARETAVARREGEIVLRFRLSPAARRVLLGRGQALRLQLIVRHSQSPRPRTLVLRLGAAR
ncbi:MAG TPA: hypothetical protein VFW48_07210 [Solirubrobacterales bacterium]|nr:hypothetical protein [Solirubrobacterales bacterium]